MRGQLDDLDEIGIDVHPREHHSATLEYFAIAVVELEAMPVALRDLELAVSFRCDSARSQAARIRSEAHRSAERLKIALVLHEIDHRIRRLRLDLARVRAFEAADVARELDARQLHAVADAEERHAIFARMPDRKQLALDAPSAEARSDENAGCAVERFEAA